MNQPQKPWCLFIEDEQNWWRLLKLVLEECGYQVDAPKNAVKLDETFALRRKFYLIVFDGCLWYKTWINYIQEIKHCLGPDSRLICISSDEAVATAAARVFRREVEYSGKDPIALERLLLEPQLVR